MYNNFSTNNTLFINKKSYKIINFIGKAIMLLADFI